MKDTHYAERTFEKDGKGGKQGKGSEKGRERRMDSQRREEIKAYKLAIRDFFLLQKITSHTTSVNTERKEILGDKI